MNNTLAELASLLRETLPALELDPQADARRPLAELGVDSLDKMSLLLSVQETYDVEFTPAQISDMLTLADIAAHLNGPAPLPMAAALAVAA